MGPGVLRGGQFQVHFFVNSFWACFFGGQYKSMLHFLGCLKILSRDSPLLSKGVSACLLIDYMFGYRINQLRGDV